MTLFLLNKVDWSCPLGECALVKIVKIWFKYTGAVIVLLTELLVFGFCPAAVQLCIHLCTVCR